MAAITNLSTSDSTFFGLIAPRPDHIFHIDTLRAQSDCFRNSYQNAAPDTVSLTTFATTTEIPSTLMPATPRGRTILSADTTWIYPVLFGIVVIFCFVRARSAEFVTSLFSMFVSAFNWREVMKLSELQYRWESRVTFALGCLTLPLVGYEIAITNGHAEIASLSGFWLYGGLVALIVGYFGAKLIIYGIVAFAFGTYHVMQQVKQLKMLSISTFALTMIPMSLLFLLTPEAYYNTLITITLSLYGVVALWQIIKALSIISINIGTLFYFVLYFCGAEILPFIWLYKGLQRVMI